MKTSILNPKGLLIIAAAFAIGVTACKKEPTPPSLPELKVLMGGEEKTSLEAAINGQVFNATVTSTRDWSETNAPSWITVSPSNGKADKETAVTITVAKNEGTTTRNASLIFATAGNAVKRTITVSQKSPDSPGVDAIYFEDLGDFRTGTEIKTDGTSVSGWPSLEQFKTWRRGGEVDQSEVTYTGTASVRNSGPLYDPVEGSAISTAPYVHMNNVMNFTIGKINLDGNTNLTFKFALQYTVSTEATSPYTPTFGDVTSSSVLVQAGFNGTGWADLSYTVAQDGNGWYWATTEFKVPAGTDELYIKFSGFTGAQGTSLRIEDLTLTEGGNGDLIEPEEPVIPTNPITITEIRALYSGGADVTINDDKVLTATVISDANATTGGNSTSKKNIVIQDANAGIAIRFATDPVPDGYYALGDELKISVKGLKISNYLGLVQLNNVPTDAVTKTGKTNTINATSVTPAQFLSGDYESMYVAVSDVQFINTAAGKKINDASFTGSGHSAVGMESKDGQEFQMFVSKYAVFFITPITIPDKSGVIKGIAAINNNVYQIQPRTASDLDGLTDARFVEAPEFNVTPLTVAVPAAGGNVTVSVTGNVAWTAAVTDGAANITSGPSPASGTAPGNISLVFPANTDIDNEKTVTLAVTTTADVTTKTFTVVFTQAKAIPVFDVSPLTVAVPAAGGNATVNVTGNVAWTAAVTDGAANITSGPSPASGTGAGTIALVFPENTDPDNEKTATLTVTTTADVGTKTFEVVFTQAKLSTTPEFGVSPLTIAVPEEGGSATVNVTGNVAWTAAVTDGAANITSGPSPASGTGAGTITLVFPENTDTDNEKTVTLTVTTTEDATTKSFAVVFTQAKASGGGEKTATFDFAVLGAGWPTSGSNGLTGDDAVFTDGDVTLTLDKGTHTSSDPGGIGGVVRMYSLKNDGGGNTLTVATTSGTISKIDFTYGSTVAANFRASVGTIASPFTTWTGNAASVVFETYSTSTTTNQQRHITKVVVTYQ